jgi:hypothetical protein
VEMSTVGKSQHPPWKDVLDTKGLSAAATLLEEYGLSCESDMSLVDEDDLLTLCSKLKPFQSKLLRKWVQGLVAEQRAAAFMKDASAAKNHSTSPPLEDKGEEDEDEEENGDEDADADEDEDSDEEDKEVHGGASGERGAGDGKSDEDVCIIGQQSAQHHKEDGKRATEGVNDAAAAKKAKTSIVKWHSKDQGSEQLIIAWEIGMIAGIMQQGYAPSEKADLSKASVRGGKALTESQYSFQLEPHFGRILEEL